MEGAMFVRYSFTVPACLILLTGGSPAVGQADKPVVFLLLSKASAERRDGDVLFRCDAALDSAAGKHLTVRSNFHSAFDGLELVVTPPTAGSWPSGRTPSTRPRPPSAGRSP
jgi:hypothetical protein